MWISTSSAPERLPLRRHQPTGRHRLLGFILHTRYRLHDSLGSSLTNSAISCKLVPSTPAAGRETHFQLQTPGQTNVIAFLVYGLNLVATTTPGGDQPGAVPYNPISHKWLRIRHASGNIIWDTSPDGITWTQYATTPYTFANDAWAVNFSCGGSTQVAPTSWWTTSTWRRA